MPYMNRKKQLNYQRKWNNEWTRKNKIEAIKIYGDKCGNCGNDDKRLLQFHHRNGKTGEKLIRVCRKIVLAGKRFPEYQLLCANCHILANIRDDTKKTIFD